MNNKKYQNEQSNLQQPHHTTFTQLQKKYSITAAIEKNVKSIDKRSDSKPILVQAFI